jgi:hypothetical protein
MVTKYESRVNPRTGKASLIKVEKPLTRQQQAMKIQREQRAAAPKPKGTLLSATTGGVERKVEAGKIVPEKSTLLQAPAFAEPEAVTVEAQPETKGMSKEALAIQKAFDEGRITQEAYGRSMQALSERGVVTFEEYKQAVAEIKDAPTEPKATKEFVFEPEIFALAQQYEFGLIDKEEYEKRYSEIATPNSYPMVRRSAEVYAEKVTPLSEDELKGVYESIGVTYDGGELTYKGKTITQEEADAMLSTGITETILGIDLAPDTYFEFEIEIDPRIRDPYFMYSPEEREYQIKAEQIRAERDLLVDAAVRDMLSPERLQTRGVGSGATVQYLRRPGSRQLAEDLLGFYGLFI